MPLIVPQMMLLLAILLTVGTGLWLMINARSVARLFRNTGFIDPGPTLGRPRQPPSKQLVIAMIVAFNVGWIASVAIWSWAMTDQAAQIVASPAP